jgi:hypothetical protein
LIKAGVTARAAPMAPGIVFVFLNRATLSRGVLCVIRRG